MKRETTRRTVVAGLGGVAASSVFGSAVGQTRNRSSTTKSSAAEGGAETYAILDGTDHATDVHVVEGDADGPTVMVTGGMHGNETSGVRAAEDIADWNIDAGTLVVVPRTNAVAVERGTRVCDHGDLNRQFPIGERPTTAVAQAVWAVVERHDPDMLLDLHRSTGIFGVDDGKVGQAIFHAGPDSGLTAVEAAEYANDEVIPDSMLSYKFDALPLNFEHDPSGLLVGKAAHDLDVTTFLVEVTSKDTSLDTRVDWTKAVVGQIFSGEVLLQEEEKEETEEDEETTNEPPIARIETQPSDAENLALHVGTTVTLDASSSTDPDGEIASYEWSVDGSEFEGGGATTEFTVGGCGVRTLTVQVTDDDGATATASVTLSTDE